jgi:hypothetical protein
MVRYLSDILSRITPSGTDDISLSSLHVIFSHLCRYVPNHEKIKLEINVYRIRLAG